MASSRHPTTSLGQLLQWEEAEEAEICMRQHVRTSGVDFVNKTMEKGASGSADREGCVMSRPQESRWSFTYICNDTLFYNENIAWQSQAVSISQCKGAVLRSCVENLS